MVKFVLVSALIILVVGGTVAFLTGPVDVFRDIRTRFEGAGLKITSLAIGACPVGVRGFKSHLPHGPRPSICRKKRSRAQQVS